MQKASIILNFNSLHINAKQVFRVFEHTVGARPT